MNTVTWCKTTYTYGDFEEGASVTDQAENTGVVAHTSPGDVPDGSVPVIFDDAADQGIVCVPADKLTLTTSGVQFPPEIPRVGEVIQIHLPGGGVIETTVAEREASSGDPKTQVTLHIKSTMFISTSRPNIWIRVGDDPYEVKIFRVS